MRKYITFACGLYFLTSLSCSQNVKSTSTEPVDFIEVARAEPRYTESKTDQSCSPYFFINSEDPAKSWVSLQSTYADVKITGAIANVKVQQTYINRSKQTLDAIYVFPGSTRAAVYGLDMIIGKRTIHAKVMEREKARKDFNQAKSEGKRATLLEQDRPNVFRMEVSNILPGDTIKVEMFYTELIEYRDKEYEFVYPTAVGPRYSTGNEDFVNHSINQLESGHKPDFNISVMIDGSIPVQMVESSTHNIKVGHNKDQSTLIELSNPKDVESGKDFILYYGLQGGKVESGLTFYEHGDEKFFLFMMQPPKKVTPEEVFPREYIFIVDVSGSMSGFPLEVSKTILKNLISSLKPTDRFNVLLFESSQAMLSKESLPATPANIHKAIQVIDNQSGGGGTELYPALKTAFNYKDPELNGFARTFIIATDGYVTVESEAFKLIKDNLSNANFVPLGIGNGVNRFLIEGMAWAGASEPFVIENKTQAEEVGKHLIQTISQPILSDISIDWGSLKPYDMYPEKVPNVFSERPVVIFGKYKGTPSGQILVKGKTATGAFEQKLTANNIKKSENEALRYLWARNKVKYLSDYASSVENYKNYNQSENKKEITALGLKYNLLTRYTSFLAVDQENTGNKSDPNIIQEEIGIEYDCIDPNVVATESNEIVACFGPSYNDVHLIEAESHPKSKDLDPSEPVEYAESMPSFPGGDEALIEFINSNLKYPYELSETSIQGRVILRFVIDENGKIRDIVVKRSLDPLLDKEAIRVLELMPNWIPGKQGGKNVSVYYMLPIRFK